MPVVVPDHDTVRAIQWTEAGLRLLDQRLLPGEESYLLIESVAEVQRAIQDMVVRGAPAIGIAAAYGVVLAAKARYHESTQNWLEGVQSDIQRLAGARPTAVNLEWALRRMRSCLNDVSGDPASVALKEARTIHEQDYQANRRMGALGAALLPQGCSVLTHCNTGSLATGGFGTALGVIRQAWSEGCLKKVYADETRPWLQGSRLTAWELSKDRIPVTLLADSAAAALMAAGKVDWVIVGADRIAANGDVANKIGTYSLAVAAHHHGIKFMVVAPLSTLDPNTETGADIPIETRVADEITRFRGSQLAAPGADALNLAFDVTPVELIDVIVTERGVVHKPSRQKLTKILPEIG